jgi:hypothetical protein
MNFIERHWFVIVAIVALWWLANYGPSTTSIDTGDPASAGASGTGASGTGPFDMGDNYWTVLGGAALLLLIL